MSTRYVLHDSIGSGGMATVHIGQLHAPLGFTRVVAIKRLHPALSHQAEFAAMLVDEARITARVRHLNVIPTLDVYVEGSECFLVMEYVEGESLAKLLRSASQAQAPVPLGVVSTILGGVLHGLHAAHVAKSGSGEPLKIIHRDVSPQNILVGSDGIARVFDFGVAKALGRLQQTRAGEFKGKLPYLAPEQFGEGAPDRRVDVYAASVTLWEALTARRLFDGGSEEEVFAKILQSRIPAPSELRPGLPPALDELVLRGLSRSPAARFGSAEEMALALEHTVPPASPREVSAWLHSLAGEALAKRAALVTEMDGGGAAAPTAVTVTAPPAPAPPAAVVAPAQTTTAMVTQRMTMPLRTRPRAAAVAHPTELSAPATPATELAYLAEAPTVVGQRSSTAPPLSVPVAPEPAARRRLVVRAALGAALLLCSLAAPAFGWMAFTNDDEAPHAAAPAALPTIVAAPRETSPAPAKPAMPAKPVAIASDPPAPVRSAEPLTSREPEPEPGAPSSAKSSAPLPRVTPKNKAVASKPDYLSSPAFSQRR
jgi:serine/threonine-protein kinase